MAFVIINEASWEKARKEIDKAFGKGKIIVKGKSIEFNRLSLENKKVNALILQHAGQKDRLKERGSGLNQVLCKISHDAGKIILIDFKEILEAKGIERAEILGRLMQNIMLLQKYNVKAGLINKSGRDSYDLFSFLLSLGSSTEFAKNAVELEIKNSLSSPRLKRRGLCGSFGCPKNPRDFGVQKTCKVFFGSEMQRPKGRGFNRISDITKNL